MFFFLFLFSLLLVSFFQTILKRFVTCTLLVKPDTALLSNIDQKYISVKFIRKWIIHKNHQSSTMHISNIHLHGTNQTNIKVLIIHVCYLLLDFTVQCAVNVSFCGYSILVESLTPVFI